MAGDRLGLDKEAVLDQQCRMRAYCSREVRQRFRAKLGLGHAKACMSGTSEARFVPGDSEVQTANGLHRGVQNDKTNSTTPATLKNFTLRNTKFSKTLTHTRCRTKGQRSTSTQKNPKQFLLGMFGIWRVSKEFELIWGSREKVLGKCPLSRVPASIFFFGLQRK